MAEEGESLVESTSGHLAEQINARRNTVDFPASNIRTTHDLSRNEAVSHAGAPARRRHNSRELLAPAESLPGVDMAIAIAMPNGQQCKCGKEIAGKRHVGGKCGDITTPKTSTLLAFTPQMVSRCGGEVRANLVPH